MFVSLVGAGRIDNFYAAHCMEDYKRVYEAQFDFSGVQGSRAKGYVVEMLNYAHGLQRGTQGDDLTSRQNSDAVLTNMASHRAFITGEWTRPRRAAACRHAERVAPAVDCVALEWRWVVARARGHSHKRSLGAGVGH